MMAWHRRAFLKASVGAGLGFALLPAAVSQRVGATSAFVDVPVYRQQRNLSCEYAALTIATAAFGTWISEYEIGGRVGPSSNPHWGFRGDIDGVWGNTEDYGVYPEALVGPLAEFGFWSDVFYAGGDGSQLRAYLDDGFPVVVWLGLWGDLSFYEYTEDGTPFKLTPGYHVVVAHGYDASGVHISDPAKGDYGYYDWSTFAWMSSVLDGMSLAVGPVG